MIFIVGKKCVVHIPDPLDSDEDRCTKSKQCPECLATFQTHFDLFHHQIEECKRNRDISITKIKSVPPLQPSKLKPAYTVVNEDEAKTCFECNKKFPSFRALNQHKRFDCGPNKAQPKKMIRCACGTVFTKQQNLMRHKKAGTCAKVMHKSGYSAKMFYCVECQVEYSSIFNLRRHKKTCPFGSNSDPLPTIKPKRVKCDDCGVSFAHRGNLARHRKVVMCGERKDEQSNDNNDSDDTTQIH